MEFDDVRDIIDWIFQGGMWIGVVVALVAVLLIAFHHARNFLARQKTVRRIVLGLLILAGLIPLAWWGNEFRLEKAGVARVVATQKRLEAAELLRIENEKARLAALDALPKIQWSRVPPARSAGPAASPGLGSNPPAGPELSVTSSPAGAEIWDGTEKIGTTPAKLTARHAGTYYLQLRYPGRVTAHLTGRVAMGQTDQAHFTLAADPMANVRSTIPGVGLELVRIEPGEFKMGSSNGDDDERPITTVRLTQPFMLGKFEVTQAEWRAVLGSRPSSSYGARRPVEQVSWNEAMLFCRELTALERAAGRLPEGYSYTLPTEAQWEYACRAGTTGDYADDIDAMAWHEGSRVPHAQPVGGKRPNAWGLHDMHGNVVEWCLDWKGPYPGAHVVDFIGPSSGAKHVVQRGGGWKIKAHFSRSAFRNSNLPANRDDHIGFRVALVAPKPRQDAAGSASARDPLALTPGIVVGLGLELVRIEAGGFLMGRRNGAENERPITEVRITQPYFLGKYEVTQGQWQAIMGTTIRQQRAKSSNEARDLVGSGFTHPVYYVSWEEAREFCRLLTERERAAGRLPTGYVYTLPTEAQWEYACRAGTTGEHAGDLDQLAWHRANSELRTKPVGQKQANSWGLHDMHGNVSEWCLDRPGDYPGGVVVDPGFVSIPSKNSSALKRVVRGGGLWSSTDECGSAFRSTQWDATDRFAAIGFRVALSPDLTTQR